MSKNRPTETQNPHDEQLDEILLMFVDDEMDYYVSQNKIVRIATNHTLDAINKVQEMRKSEI